MSAAATATDRIGFIGLGMMGLSISLHDAQR